MVAIGIGHCSGVGVGRECVIIVGRCTDIDANGVGIENGIP